MIVGEKDKLEKDSIMFRLGEAIEKFFENFKRGATPA